jgi:RND family efflux transporter MFP subunit
VPYIRYGDRVEVRVPSLNRSFPGQVARFSADVEQDTRTMHTEVDVPNPTGVLVAGMYAEATLRIDSTNQSITVPPEAVNIEGDARSVWVVSPFGKVEKRIVTLGVETPNDVEVVSGLKEGEMVAVGDRSSLTEGEMVRPKQVHLVRYEAGG